MAICMPKRYLFFKVLLAEVSQVGHAEHTRFQCLEISLIGPSQRKALHRSAEEPTNEASSWMIQ